MFFTDLKKKKLQQSSQKKIVKYNQNIKEQGN